MEGAEIKPDIHQSTATASILRPHHQELTDECIVISDSEDEQYSSSCASEERPAQAKGRQDICISRCGEPRDKDQHQLLLWTMLTMLRSTIVLASRSSLMRRFWARSNHVLLESGSTRQLHLTHFAHAGEKCVVCRQRTCSSELPRCGSCDRPLHEECTVSLTLPLSAYCFWCKDCQEQPYLRGALLEVICGGSQHHNSPAQRVPLFAMEMFNVKMAHTWFRPLIKVPQITCATN